MRADVLDTRLLQWGLSCHAIEQSAGPAPLHQTENITCRGRRFAQLNRNQGIVNISLVGQEVGLEGRHTKTRSNGFNDLDRFLIFLNGIGNESPVVIDLPQCVQRLPLLLDQPSLLRSRKRDLEIGLGFVLAMQASQNFPSIKTRLDNSPAVRRLL